MKFQLGDRVRVGDTYHIEQFRKIIGTITNVGSQSYQVRLPGLQYNWITEPDLELWDIEEEQMTDDKKTEIFNKINAIPNVCDNSKTAIRELFEEVLDIKFKPEWHDIRVSPGDLARITFNDSHVENAVVAKIDHDDCFVLISTSTGKNYACPITSLSDYVLLYQLVPYKNEIASVKMIVKRHID